MRFVPVHEFNRSAQIWPELRKERVLVVTKNGKPIAIVSATDEESVEQSLADIRQARALRAMKQMQERSIAFKRAKRSAKEIEKEITVARQSRRR